MHQAQAVRPARTLAKKGNIPVGYYKDEKKTAETFRTINGVRYAIPGTTPKSRRTARSPCWVVARCRSTAAARRSTPKRSRPL